MIRATLLVCVACASLSCRPEPPQPPPPVRVWNIDIRSLHNSYRDHSERWTSQTVRITLLKGSCVVAGAELHWHANSPQEPPSVVFKCQSLPQEPATLEVVAVCVGAVEDGKLRSNGTRFHVRLRTVSVQVVR